MSLIPMDNAHFVIALQNDTNQMYENIKWAKERFSMYNQNCTVGNMTSAGISAGDQSAILAFITDLSRLVTLYSGSVPSNSADYIFDINAIRGIS